MQENVKNAGANPPSETAQLVYVIALGLCFYVAISSGFL